MPAAPASRVAKESAMSSPDRTPKPEDVALEKAADAWRTQTSWDWSSDGLEAACWAFHEHMMEAQQRSIPHPGLWFHETDGTIRAPKVSDT